MFKLYMLEILIAASLWVAVVSKPGSYEPVLSPSKTFPAIKFVIGDYVEGARVLKEVSFSSTDFSIGLRNFKKEFIFPSVYTDNAIAALEQPITKIIVLVDITHAEQKVEIEVKNGGINQTSVELEINIEKSHNFYYKVVLFGPPF